MQFRGMTSIALIAEERSLPRLPNCQLRKPSRQPKKRSQQRLCLLPVA
jgi:hypothetical protein